MTNLGVLATGCAEGTVGGHGDGVQIAGVTNVVGLQLAVGQVPHLHITLSSPDSTTQSIDVERHERLLLYC